MTSMMRRRVARGAICSMLALCALTACTSGAAARPAHPTVTAAQPSGLPQGLRQATSVPTDVPNTPSLRGNVKIGKCQQSGGGWSAAGTAANPGTKAVSYTITVFFTTDRGTVIGVGSTKVTVAAGGRDDWTVASKLTPAPNTRCVLRGVA